jgi:hypothetical protein
MLHAGADSMNPRHGLRHPCWWGALALLLVNDHLLKGAGVLPDWITGKLSDLAGMLVAPVVLAVILRVSSRRGWLAAHAAVGFGFAAINLWPAAARGFESLMALTPFPWAIVVDPTDLIALPMLVVSCRLFAEPAEGRKRWSARAAEATGLVVGAVACMATSPPPCEGDECRNTEPPQQIPQESAALVLANTTAQERLVRVRPLHANVVVDCPTMMADPSLVLSRDLFAPADAWLLQPGRALPLQSRGACTAYLVDAQGLDPVLLAWNTADFPSTTLVTDATPSPRTLIMRDAGGRLEIDPHAALFEAPSSEPVAPGPGCEVPVDEVGIDWSVPPLGQDLIVSIASSPDGCHMVELESSEMFVCLPLASLPFAAGEILAIHPWSALGSFPESGETTDAEGIVLETENVSIWAVRGNALARDNQSGLFDPERDYDATVETSPGCGLHHDECGNAVAPLSITVLGGGVEGIASGGAGDALALDDAGTTLHIVRAQHMPIRDLDCAPYAEHDQYFESVLVKPNQGM